MFPCRSGSIHLYEPDKYRLDKAGATSYGYDSHLPEGSAMRRGKLHHYSRNAHDCALEEDGRCQLCRRVVRALVMAKGQRV